MLVLVDKYSSVQNLKKRVLDMAIKDINTNSPYYSEYKLTDKSGRSGKGIKLTHLKIKFKKKSVIDGESKDKTSKQSTPPPETEMITSNDDLTEAQKQALASVNKYIADNKIDDKKHIENLKRKALKDSWNMKTTQSTIIPKSKFSEPLPQDNLKFKGMKK